MWFRVDDNLHDHRKTRRVRRSSTDKHRDVAPLGLWVLAGSWCGRNLTGGFIPTEVLEEWDDHALPLAQRLMDAGLWSEEERDGEPGYLFKDWEERNPDQADGVYGNHLRWHVKRDRPNPDCAYCTGKSRGDNRGDVAPISGATIGATSGGDIPTRPDPTRPDHIQTSSTKADTDTRFADFWALYPRKEAKGAAARAWTKAAKAAGGGDVILEALRKQLPWFATQKSPRGDYRPYAASWLNAERWTDVKDTPGAGPKDQLPEAWR